MSHKYVQEVCQRVVNNKDQRFHTDFWSDIDTPGNMIILNRHVGLPVVVCHDYG